MAKKPKVKKDITKAQVLAWLRAKTEDALERAADAEEEARAIRGDAEELEQIFEDLSGL